MADFIQTHGLDTFRHIDDANEALFAHFGVPYQPAWVFIDSKGNGVRVFGAVPEQDLISFLEDLAQDRLPNA